MAFQPGLPGSQFPSDDALIRRIQDLERDMRELRSANPFAPMGMKPIPGGVEIQGTLSLPAGIINNDALANPSSPYAGHADSDTFALATGENSEKLALSIPVPSGFTRAHVFAAATMQAYNSNASRDEMFVECRIAGAGPGFSSEASAPANSIGFCGSNAAAVLTGLTGPFSVSVVASSGVFAWPADIRNIVNLNVLVTFLR